MKRVLLWTVGGLALVVTAGVFAAAARRPPPPTPEEQFRRNAERLRAEKLEPRFERLRALHAPKTPPRRGEWLAEYPEEGQSFAEYLERRPRRATPDRRTLYLQPIGVFEGAQQKIVEDTADFTARFFGLPVKTLPAIPLVKVPARARRKNPGTGQEQLLAPFLNESILAPGKPEDALAVLGLTAVDLYPEESWNFVFGQAHPGLGVGVWSIYRNGDPSTPEGYRQCLLRTITTATHELGHLFDIDHCVGWECQMNGSNHREEADSRPLELCPHCLQKLVHGTGADPAARFRALAEFDRAHALPIEAAFVERSLKALEDPKP